MKPDRLGQDRWFGATSWRACTTFVQAHPVITLAAMLGGNIGMVLWHLFCPETLVGDGVPLMLAMALWVGGGSVLFAGALRQAVTGAQRVGQKMAFVHQQLENQKLELARQNAELAAARAEVQLANASVDEHLKNLEAARTSTFHMMQEMESSRREAETATQAKSEFLANMSHEIRTPMTAIVGYADLLLEEEGLECAPPHRVEALETIQKNSQYLLAIINDILDLSKIEAGKMTLEQIACSPHQIVHDVVSLMRHRAQQKGLILGVAFASPCPKTIRTDPTRLRQILVNLVGNAIKFTQKGSIRVVVQMADSPDLPNPHMRLDVIDTGMGITDEQKSNLFQAFNQADTSTTRKFGGTGLGLTICRRLAKMLGGDIDVTSAPNQGSTFAFTIETGSLAGVPMAEDHCDRSEVVGPRTDGDVMINTPLDCRILLAEDGPDNQRLISFVLRKVGAEVVVAENGRIACDIAMSAYRAGRPFDVILMDMQMPELDGYGAARQLRGENYRGPIIALTAHAMSSDRDKCLEAGCDDYTTKPIKRAELLRMIRGYLNDTQCV